MADMGLGSAIIQKKSLLDSDIESIFSFSFYLAVILAVGFSLFSIPLSIIYANYVYRYLGLILAVSLFFNTLNTVPNALLLKDKKFIVIGLRLVIVNVSSSFLTILLAYFGFRYYALVLNSVISAFFTFIWNYKSKPVKFRLKFKKTSIMKIKNYSGFLFSFNIINYFTRNLDNLLIGKFWGNVPLAYYDKAYRLMIYPVQNLTNVITPVLHPILSEYQNNKKYVYEKFLLTVKILSLLGVFISVYCFFSSNEIILIVFGPKWKESIPCFKWLSISIWAQMINATSGTMFETLTKTKLQFKRGIFIAVVTSIAILAGLLTGSLQKISIYVTIAFNIHFLSMVYFLVHLGFGESSFDFFKRLLPDLFIACILIVFMNAANMVMIDNLFLSALYKGIICTMAYILGLFVTKQYKVLLNLIKKKI
jgi:PST family polysaccharide transporter